MKRLRLWISGIDFNSYELNLNTVVTGFITNYDPGKKESIAVITMDEFKSVLEKNKFLAEDNLKLDKQLNENTRRCADCDELAEKKKEKYRYHKYNIEVDSEYCSCRCGRTWLSSKDEYMIDLKIREELEKKLDFCLDHIEKIKKVSEEFSQMQDIMAEAKIWVK